MMKFKILLQIFAMLLPWGIRRWILNSVFGYKIHQTARIGKSILLPKALIMAEYSSIGHLNVAHGLEELRMDAHSTIGNLNWISGYPLEQTRYFAKFKNRFPQLYMEEHSIIVNRNILDCTDRLTMRRFSAIAGNRSQILTHSVDLGTNNQACAPVTIGTYSFIGSGSMVLKGVTLADHCVVMAGSVLAKNQTESYKLIAGVPAQAIRNLSPKLPFFNRTKGETD